MLVSAGMKAMTWLKVGGCVLIALAAIAAADTRQVRVSGPAPGEGISHAIASRVDACSVAQDEGANGGCCKKEAKSQRQHSGCCRK